MHPQPTMTDRLDLRALGKCLAAQDDIVLAYLFGSAARGELRPDSDLDIAVLLVDNLDRKTQVECQLALMGLLQAYSNCEVQVTLLNHAPPLLQVQVLKEGTLLVARSQADRVAFQVDAQKRYFDLLPMLAFFDEVQRRRLQEGTFGQRRTRTARTLDIARRLHQRLARSAGR